MVLWSLATGAGGLAPTFTALILTRCLVGVGEGAYGPLAPALISDFFPVSSRGRVLACFYIALPVGGALGYVLGGQIAHWDEAQQSWRWAFFVVVLPGLILGLLSFLMSEPKLGGADAISKPARRVTWRDSRILWKTPSFVFDTLGMTAMTFAMGTLAWWMPDYLKSHDVPPLWGLDSRSVFGLITALAGLAGTVAGGSAGDRLRRRIPSSYFLVSGVGLLVQRAGGAAVSGSAVSHGMGLHFPLRVLHVLQYRADEHDPGQCGPSVLAADRLCREHLRDPHFW